MSIDTLEYVKTLESAGVERKVAKAHLRAMNQHPLPEIATRNDLGQMEQRLDSTDRGGNVESGLCRAGRWPCHWWLSDQVRTLM
jgi:hypothetical protein